MALYIRGGCGARRAGGPRARGDMRRTAYPQTTATGARGAARHRGNRSCQRQIAERRRRIPANEPNDSQWTQRLQANLGCSRPGRRRKVPGCRLARLRANRRENDKLRFEESTRSSYAALRATPRIRKYRLADRKSRQRHDRSLPCSSFLQLDQARAISIRQDSETGNSNSVAPLYVNRGGRSSAPSVRFAIFTIYS